MLITRTVQCPYCGEAFATELDLSAGSQHYVEDCQICCRPIEFLLQLNASDELESLVLKRDDD